MADVLAHRGPDGSSCYIAGNIGLGFRRLSIIDLKTGMQPMFNEDQSIVAICNGEIFNHLELRTRLEASGHHFYSKSDVEVLPHLYEMYGMEMVDHLDGQFAFVVYDKRARKLIAARDHFGVAPFFYTVQNGLFIFASEIKAILRHPGIDKKVDLTGLDQILTFPGLISPRTMFAGISSLPPGHMVVAEHGRQVRSQEYWDINFRQASPPGEAIPDDSGIEELASRLHSSVSKRLLADVDVGLYLSGGLDSSLIASLVHELDPSICRHSFSIDFFERELSEGRYQRLIAGHIHSRHHSRLFEWQDISERLARVVLHCECPLQETFDTAALMLSESVRQNGLKVVLAGQGADEIFGGYVGYRFDNFRHSRPHQATNNASEAQIQYELWGDSSFFYEKNYFQHRQAKQILYSEEIRSGFSDIDCLRSLPINKDRLKGRHPFHQRSYLDLKLRLSDHLLGDHGDRMTFANGVEARYPFLDKDLLDCVSQIPPQAILDGYCEKSILKKIAANRVPEPIIRREKLGFAAPGTPVLVREKVNLIQDMLCPERIRKAGYFDCSAVEQLRRKYEEPEFHLHVPYENDLLAVVITFGLFLEIFEMPDL
jgi:asparagine synthase (glutamine-hydrolysing)